MADSGALGRIRLWRGDFPRFAEDCLRVLDKDGRIVPFRMNRAQLHIHEILERQLEEIGRVRAIILKGRQMGISTYVAGRFFRRVLLDPGRQAAVIAHRKDSTANLAEMSKRFYRELDPVLQRPLKKSNETQMYFEGRDCHYGVFTAAGRGIGRGFTLNLLHGSEVGFWERAKELLSGLRNALGISDGTEELLESTGNTMANIFYHMWSMSEAGFSTLSKEEGLYVHKCIFLPWWWDDGYRMRPWPGLDLYQVDIGADQTAGGYCDEYGLEEEQGAWYVHSLRTTVLGDTYLMRQEYPATAVEAFQGSGGGSLIRSNDILKARHNSIADLDIRNLPLVMGVDPARPDKDLDDTGSRRHDRFAIIFRRGPKAFGLESRHDLDGPRGAEYIYRKVMEHGVDRVCVDVGGVGVSVVDHLLRMDGMRGKVFAINFAHVSLDPDRFVAKRDEMWGLMKDWFEGRSDVGVDIPDSDELHADLSGPLFDYEKNRLKLESKKEMRKRQIRSPDCADALALTFAVPDRAVLGYDSYGRPLSEKPNSWRPPKSTASEWTRGLSSFHRGDSNRFWR